jgi:hypothetical protein
MTEHTNTRIPAPLYAAAGASDLAYQQLRKLPALYAATLRAATSGRAELREKAVTTTSELRERAVATTTELREKALAGTEELREKTTATVKAANATATELRDRAATPRDLDIDRLRELARRNAAAFLAGAHVAQEKAIAVYGDLVARGERVIGGGVLEVADTVNADIEASERAAELPAKPATSAAAKTAKAPAKAAKPAKRTRAASTSK